MREAGFWILFLALLVLAGSARFYDIGRKPFHADEANQAVKFATLLETGEYQYDPHDHHGPTLYYMALPAAWIAGAGSRAELNEAIMRWLPALFGTIMLLPLLLFRDAFGRIGMLVVGGYVAVSPIMVYYSRYFIQETFLVFFMLCFLGGLWRYVNNQRWWWACWLGVSAGLMHATKETFVLALAAALIALPFMGPVRWKRLFLHILPAGLCAVFVSVLFYSSFFTHWPGVSDSVMTYVHMLDRAGGEGHEKPWWYYASLLWWWEERGFRLSEALLIGLFLVGAGVALLRRGAGAFMLIFSLVLFGIYSVIEYKTPWLAINFVPVMALVGASVWGAKTEASGSWFRYLLLPLIAFGLYDLGKQTWSSSIQWHSDVRNPLAYTQTVNDLNRWTTDRLDGENGLLALQDQLRIHVVHPNPWPLPWTLREQQVGYWQTAPSNQPPGYLDADMVLFHEDAEEAVIGQLQGDYYRDYFGLRPGEMVLARVRADLWLQHVDPASFPEELGPWRHKAMASDWQIHMVHTNEVEAAGAAQAAFEEVDRLEQLLSSYVESSDVSKIGRGKAGKPIVVSPETIECLEIAERMRMDSDGLFDVAYATGGQRPVFEINVQKLTVTPLVDEVKIDLGGIGKGFALDKIAEFLREDYGIKDCLVDAASTALAVGDRPWPVGINGRRIALQGRAMSASGTDVKGTHIVNPATGNEVPLGDQVWAFGATAAEADAKSTAAFLKK